jgi:uncharacterized alpha-E superfamily protein
VLSRLIDALYWLGRYAERAENTARIVDVNYHASMQLETAMPSFSDEDGDGPFSLNPWAPTEPESMVEWLILDDDNPSSVAACLSQSHRNAQTARNKIDEETWECLNRAYLQYGSPDPTILEDDRLHEYCTNVRRILNEFTGSLQSTMFRGEEWYYLTSGRFLERADNCLRQLEVFVAESERDAPGIHSRSKNRLFLESIGATMLLQNEPPEVLEQPELIRTFLLTSTKSPRSLLFLLEALNRNLSELKETYYPNRRLQFEELTELIDTLRSDAAEPGNKKSFEDWIRRLANISNKLTEEFKRNVSAEDVQPPGRSYQSQ